MADRARVFIISSRESIDVVTAIESRLHHTAEVIPWFVNEVMTPGRSTIDNLEAVARTVDFAVAVVGRDDVTHSRGVEQASPRDNVVFEAGLLMGVLGSSRVVLAIPQGTDTKRPSDWLGLTPVEYAIPSKPDAWDRAVGPATTRIRLAIEQIGPILRAGERPQICRRDEVDSSVGSATSRIDKAQAGTFISGNDCKYVVESLSPALTRALDRGVSVEILCVDPAGAGATTLGLVDERFPTAESFARSMLSVEGQLRDLRDAYQSFRFRYLPFAPAFGLFLTDPGLDAGVCKVEVYTAKPLSPISSRPHLIFPPSEPEWRSYWRQQWTNYWNMSTEPT